MSEEDVPSAAMTEKEVDALLRMDMENIVKMFTLDSQPPQSLFLLPQSPVIAECLPEAMEPQPQPHPQHFLAGISGYQPPQSQTQVWNVVDLEQCATDVGGNQPPPQLQSPPQPWSRPWPQPHEFFTDTCDYQPLQSQPQFDMVLAECMPEATQPWPQPHPQQFLAGICGYQPPHPQPQPSVWTWEENEAIESVIANDFHDVIRNQWEPVAAGVVGNIPAQLQERFRTLTNVVNVMQNDYTTNNPLNAAPENMTMMMEHNPLSIPIVHATPPPPPPYSTHHQHHRAEAVAAMAVPMEITESSSAMEAATREQYQHANSNIIQHQPPSPMATSNNNERKTVHWTIEEHRLFVKGYEEVGKNWSRISEEHVKTKTYQQVVSHAQKFFEHKKRLARGEKLRRSIHDITDYRTVP